MTATTNFLQWNNGKTNQESDVAYAADTQRVNGAAEDDTLPSPLFNKVIYQLTTFVAALAQALLSKGYSTSDADLAALISVLENIATAADLAAYATLAGFEFWYSTGISGYFKMPSCLGGLVLQFGQTSLARQSTVDITFPLTFPEQAILAMPVIGYLIDSTTNAYVGGQPLSTSQMRITCLGSPAGGAEGVWWFALGY